MRSILLVKLIGGQMWKGCVGEDVEFRDDSRLKILNYLKSMLLVSPVT